MADPGGRDPSNLAASEAFRKHSADLIRAIQDPEVIAWELYSDQVISDSVVDDVSVAALSPVQKKTRLLAAVRDQIAVNPAKIAKFIQALRKQPIMEEVARKLEETYRSMLCTTAPVVTSESTPTLPSPSKNTEPPGAVNVILGKWPPSPSKQHTNQTKNTDSPLSHSQRPQSNSPITTPTETNNEPRDLTELPPSPKRIKVLPPRHHPIICKNSHEPLKQVSTQPDTLIDVYVSYLKSVYQRQKFPSYGKWPPSPSKRYINLAVVGKDKVSKEEADEFMRATIHGDVDDIVRKKGSISMAQVATPKQGVWPRFILVEGAPGVGKSTFAWKMCRKWSKGKILQHYRLVVLLRLREKKVQEARSVSDLFQYYNDEIQQKVVHEIEQSGGKGVLLLIEGFDELPTELRTPQSFFLDVIRGEVLPEATVLVTSRPPASGALYREDISQHIEVVGFTSENVQSYLESILGSDPTLLSEFQKYLECYPHIRNMMYIPLNSAIVIEVYRTSKTDKSVIPKTKTELYSSMIRSLLLRYLDGHPVYGERQWRIRSFRDLPPDVYTQLCELGRIAYEGIVRGQQVIFSELSDDFETLGLMQCVPELYVDEGPAVSHNFLHLTVQEYMAALYLSQQPVEKQMKHFIHYKKGPQEWSHFKMVFLFLAGLTHFKGYSNDHLKMLLCGSVSDEDTGSDLELGKDTGSDSEDAGSDSEDAGSDTEDAGSDSEDAGSDSEDAGSDSADKSDQDSSAIVFISLDVLHWLFESRDTNLDSSVLGSPLVGVRLRAITSFDCFVLGYCISHSNCTWNIHLDFSRFGDEGVEMLVRGTLEGRLHFTGSISHLKMMDDGFTTEGLKYLLELPKHLLGGRLKKLDLCNNELDSESCRLLSHSIPAMTSLKSLDLYSNPIGNGGSVPLIRSLCTLKYFRELNMGSTRIGVEDCRALSELLSSSASLEELYIYHNDLSPEAVELIISGLHHNTGLKRLEMNISKLSTENCVSLAAVLNQNHSLVILNVSHCSIGSEGASHLADTLCTNDTLWELYMGNNPIGDKGATAFSEMLTHNKSLKVLSLKATQIGEEGTQRLITSLTHNTTLFELYLPKKHKSHSTSSEEYRRVKDRIKWLL